MTEPVVVVQAVCSDRLCCVWTVPEGAVDDDMRHLMDVCDGEAWHESGVAVTESMRALEQRLEELACEGAAQRRKHAARVVLDPGQAACRIVTLWFPL